MSNDVKDKAQALYIEGLRAQGQGLFDEALARFDECISLDAGHFDCLIGRAEVLIKLARFDEGLLAYDEAHKVELPVGCHAMFLKAHALVELERHDDALDVYRNITAERPGLKEAWLLQAVMLEFMGYTDYALGALQRALTLAPELPEALYLKGILLDDSARPREALQCVEAALKGREGSAQTWFFKGTLLAKIGRIPECMEAYRKTIELDPSNERAHYLLACESALVGDKALALRYLAASVALNPRRRKEAHLDEDFEAYYDDEEFKAIVGAGKAMAKNAQT